MMLRPKRIGPCRREWNDGDELAILAIARQNNDGSPLDHLRHDIAMKVAHDDFTRPGLIEQRHLMVLRQANST